MIYIVLGTKAQLIKMGPIMKDLELSKQQYSFIHTGQHQETMMDLIENFQIKKPDVYLYKGKDITGILQVIPWMLKILFVTYKNKNRLFDKNGIVVVHGDTFSTLLGALIGKLNKLKVAHIESGLRSFNIFHPFPEELNRLIVFRLTDYFFCPGMWAVKNVTKYGKFIINTYANTIYDSINLAIKNTKNVNLPQKKYVVCSIHRFENIFYKERFNKILAIIEEISCSFEVHFILHPPTLKKLKAFNYDKRLAKYKNIKLKKRTDFFAFNKLLENSEFVITDGGSNQEECFILGKPCLLMRNTTERKEGLKSNVVISNLNFNVAKTFTKNYKKYKTKPLHLHHSPSKIIVKELKRFDNE